jgi:flagellar hook-basal body complex protein FliE
MMAVNAVPSSPVVPTARALPSAVGPAKSNSPFSQVISKVVSEANEQQLHSENVVRDFVSGKTENVHDLVLSVAKADLSFRLVLEIRNRLIESYQEIMRMQM